MPCPVPDKTKKKSTNKYQPGWRKWHMIDLSTLDTKEKWIQKLEFLHQDSMVAMRAALEELRLK